MKERRSFILGSVAVLAVAGALGAWLSTGGSSLLNPQSEEALAERAQYFWDLKIAGDVLGAYEYMTEGFRRRVTPAQFAKEGGRVIRTGAQVKEVELDEKGGLVHIELKHRFDHPNFREDELTSTVTDRWVFENGAWHRWPPGL